jgi:thioredoxin reductase (NADPH)
VFASTFRRASPRFLSLFSVPVAAAASHNQRVSPTVGLSTASSLTAVPKVDSRRMHSKVVSK